MLKIEAVASVTYTCTISDEDEKKILKHINENPERFEFMSAKSAILKAVEDLDSNCKIDVYKSCTESDVSTEEYKWSEFEERDAIEIINERYHI